MRSTLLFCTALAMASTAHLAEKEDVYAKGIEKLKEVLGEGANATAVKIIVAEEAAALGITTEQHWATCYDEAFSVTDSDTDGKDEKGVKEFSKNGQNITFENKEQIIPKLKKHLPKTHTRLVKFVEENLTKDHRAPESIEEAEAKAFHPSLNDDDDDTETIEQEFEKNGHLLALNNSDDVFPALKKHLPKTYEALVKLVGENFKDYDEEMEEIGDKDATAFMKNLKDAALDMLVQWTQARGDADKQLKLYPAGAKALAKVMTDWEDLSKASKIAMEKKTCIQTTFRLFDELSENKGQIMKLKEQVNATIAMGELVEKLSKKAENANKQ